MATERIVVHSSVVSEFTKEFKAATTQLFGEGTPVPTLVTAAGVERNRQLVSDAVQKGAKVIQGNHMAVEDQKTQMRPVILESVKMGMDLYHQESFGPIVSLYVVESEDEAIELANDTLYGLASAVFTQNLFNGFRVAKQIQAA
jgi:acyl-CoA reductase-like NAD-dependent aldehyde dehydrogenase